MDWLREHRPDLVERYERALRARAPTCRRTSAGAIELRRRRAVAARSPQSDRYHRRGSRRGACEPAGGGARTGSGRVRQESLF